MLDTIERRPAIIVVDDDPVLATVLQRLIRKTAASYEVVSVADGAAALAQFEQWQVPLVITDYNLLSSLTGLKLTQAIKARSPNTRVVLISAYATPELERQAREHQVDYYLPKPFLLQDLEQIVLAVLG